MSLHWTQDNRGCAINALECWLRRGQFPRSVCCLHPDGTHCLSNCQLKDPVALDGNTASYLSTSSGYAMATWVEATKSDLDFGPADRTARMDGLGAWSIGEADLQGERHRV